VKPTLDSRAERTRAGLLRAFVELIFRDGFENISVHAIVAAAGTARSTFYEHFSSKEDILGASMAHFFNVMADCVTSDVEPAELRWVLEHFWDNRRLVDASLPSGGDRDSGSANGARRILAPWPRLLHPRPPRPRPPPDHPRRRARALRLTRDLRPPRG